MMNRIDIIFIIKRHLKTLRRMDSDSDRMPLEDIFTFFILPAVLSGLLTYKKVSLESQIGNLISIISIFGGFLFNLLAIIYNYLDKPSSSQVKERRLFAKEINTNISFCVVISVVTILFLLGYNLSPDKLNFSIKLYSITIYVKAILLSINYFLLFLFLFSLLMVLTRIYVLLELENKGK